MSAQCSIRFIRSGASRAIATIAAVSLLGVAALVLNGDLPEAPRSADDTVVLRETAGLRAEISPSGVSLFTAHAPRGYTISTTGLGCEGDLRALPPASIVQREGRVEAHRDGTDLVEWYVGGPQGIEQGFTLATRPRCRTDGALLVEMALGGGLRAVFPSGSRSAVLQDESGATVLRYADLAVTDAMGRALPAHLETEPGRLRLRVEDEGAVYPLVIDPLIGTVQAKLTPSDAQPGLHLGNAVALSGDTAVIGTDVTSVAADGAGGAGGSGGNAAPVNRAYVFVRRDGTWTEDAQLRAKQGTTSGTYASAVSIDGDTIVVADRDADTADVFVRGGGTWSREATLEPVDSMGGVYQVSQVAVHHQTAVLAAYGGGVYVFVRSAGTWAQEAKLELPDSDDFGPHTVAVAGDTIAVGSASGQSEEVHIFVRNGGVWSEEATLVASPPGGVLGGPVSLSGDTLLASASEGPCVFARKGGLWTQQVRLVPSTHYSVSQSQLSSGAVSDDGAVVPELIYRQGDGGVFYSLVVAIYKRTGEEWTKENEVLIEDPVIDGQLGPIAMSGNTFIVGSRAADPDLAGAAYALVIESDSDADGCTCRSGRGGSPATPLATAAILALAIAGRRRRTH